MSRKREDSLLCKSLNNFHNLELLCKVDEKQKKALEKIMKKKPDLARSLNIYADGVKYYINKQQHRDKLLANKDITPLYEILEHPQTTKQVLPTINKNNNARDLHTESVERRKSGVAKQTQVTPFAHRSRKVHIPSLNPPKILPKDREMPKMKFNYYVSQGNNSELVKSVLSKRESHWNLVNPQFTYKHFVWQQSYTGMDFNKAMSNDGVYARTMYNYFEFHKNITSKSGLAHSLMVFLKEKAFSIIPLVFVLSFRQNEWQKDVLQFSEFYLQHNPLKLVSNKVSLDFDFYVPNLQTQKPFLKYNMNLQDTLLSDSQYLWLLKPADWNRGEGVHVFSSLEEVEQLIKQYYSGKGCYECKDFVIQKYIEKPLLLNERKFDIRCWVLMSQEMELYIFQEAYIRTSGAKFNLDDKDRYIHLTNNAIQKNAQNYGQFEDGNQLSLNQFQEILKQSLLKYSSKSEQKHNFRDQSWNTIKEYVKLTIQSTKINRRNRKYCMQLFGYDFMIDQNYKVWLIEVNANPCLEESSQLLKMLIPRMLDDAFKLTIDIVFTPNIEFNGVYPVDGYKDDENMWQQLEY